MKELIAVAYEGGMDAVEAKLIAETALELNPMSLTAQLSWVKQASLKRSQGHPLQYLMGNQTFLNHRYEVGPGVLIPRPETEILVDFALKTLFSEIQANTSRTYLGFEIGLGSGAISVELLCDLPQLKMIASEVSPVAREYAIKNSARILGTEKDRLTVQFVSDAENLFPFEIGTTHFDFLISNPPYLSPEDEIGSDVLNHEPHLALFPANADPLYFYRRIATESRDYLVPGGWIFLEIAHNRANETLALFENSNYDHARLVNDLTGRPRCLIAKTTNDPFRLNCSWTD